MLLWIVARYAPIKMRSDLGRGHPVAAKEMPISLMAHRQRNFCFLAARRVSETGSLVRA